MNRLFFLKHYPLSKLIFFLFLFFLPQQFGPHFWPSFSYVHGIRLDYLSPTLYVSTILLIILLLLKGKDVFKTNLKFLKNTKVLIFATCLLLPLIYAYSIPALYFGVLKVCMLLFLGLYVSSEVNKKDLPIIIFIFGISAFFESILALGQFINQGSLNGIFYYAGERNYSASSLGIAVMNTSSGLLVRPYATFPHPNVLAYFLFVASVFLVYVYTNAKQKLAKFLLVFLQVVIQVGLFLTFSRILILLDGALFVILFLLYKRTHFKISAVLFGLGLIGFLLYILVFNLRFLNFSNILPDISSRNELVPIALSAVNAYPLGLGLHNFYYYQAGIQTQFTSVYLQPVHNIFLLLLAESGIVCTLLFVYFLGLTLVKLSKQVKKDKELTLNVILLAIVLVSIISGMFDHYLITIQQGQLLFAIILGLCWNKHLESRKTSKGLELELPAEDR
ncbi:MAG: O-antigen ligase family protein [Candidatus Levybacteria bacterium]|nr:O-antigen ligase family protein [Candidatus Levybacteria bacterium]